MSKCGPREDKYILRKPLSMEEYPLNILYSGITNKNIIENEDGAIEK